MKISLVVLALSIALFGCQSQYKLTKPSGNWVNVNPVEKKSN